MTQSKKQFKRTMFLKVGKTFHQFCTTKEYLSTKYRLTFAEFISCSGIGKFTVCY